MGKERRGCDAKADVTRAAQFLKEGPWGEVVMLEIMKFARWQYSWARTLWRRSGDGVRGRGGWKKGGGG